MAQEEFEAPRQRNTERVVALMPPGTKKRLNRLVIRMDATSRSQVIRRAIFLLETLIVEQDRGSKIQLHDPDGSKTWLIVL